MLLQFSVRNALSFRDEVTLNMTPAKGRLMKEHIITDEAGKKVSALPVAAIYGANASGKSNLVKSLGFVQKLVVKGTRPQRPISVMNFLLSAKNINEPSRYEITFKKNGILYNYGFVATTTEILEEWLFANYTATEVKLFERITKNGKTTVEPGNKLAASSNRPFIGYVAMGTRPNQLFLTEANEKNIDALKPVCDWFRNDLIIIYPDSEYPALELRAHSDGEFAEYLGKVLKNADSGIDGIHSDKELFDPKVHLKGIPPDVQNQIVETLQNEKIAGGAFFSGPNGNIALFADRTKGKATELHTYTLKTVHKRDDGETVDFETKLESDGTRRLMELVPMLMGFEKIEKVFVIDELDRSLHTHLSRSILESFIEGVKKKKARSQLIFTTHDTNLLDRNLLRRDEIWFVEKCRDKASHLTSLAEYRISEGLNYQNGYLSGRFGAIPFIGDPKKLLR